MSSCSSCSSASGCSSKGNPGGAGCMESAMARQDQIIADRLAHIRHKIFVMSGKGGVGKSSVTVNTAAALAHRGFKVGILDVDMHGPSVPNLLGLKATIEMNEKNELIPAMYNENLAVISMDSFLQDRDQAILWRGPKKTAAIRQFLSDVAWGPLDFLLIDSPPGTGDEHMTILKTITDAQSVTVTTPQEISLADVRKAVNFLQVAEGKVLGVVENMSGLVCPHCHQEIDLFKKGGGEELAKHYGIPFYTLGPTSTIDMNCPTGDDIKIELRDPEEIKEKFYAEPMALKEVKCYNPAIDVTDHTLVTGIVTEKGICYPPFNESLKKLFED